ncbi:MAG: hypothetical protein WCW30_04560 [Candidatus Gracilibacteria bacterium]
MKLIAIKGKILPFFFENVGTRHGGLLNFCHHHGADETAIFFSKFSFGNLHEQDFFIVHDVTNIQLVFGLAHNVTNEFSGHELPHFIEEWHDGFVVEFFAPSRELVDPEIFNHRILNVGHDFLAIIFVGKHL